MNVWFGFFFVFVVFLFSLAFSLTKRFYYFYEAKRATPNNFLEKHKTTFGFLLYTHVRKKDFLFFDAKNFSSVTVT